MKVALDKQSVSRWQVDNGQRLSSFSFLPSVPQLQIPSPPSPLLVFPSTAHSLVLFIHISLFTVFPFPLSLEFDHRTIDYIRNQPSWRSGHVKLPRVYMSNKMENPRNCFRLTPQLTRTFVSHVIGQHRNFDEMIESKRTSNITRICKKYFTACLFTMNSMLEECYFQNVCTSCRHLANAKN